MDPGVMRLREYGSAWLRSGCPLVFHRGHKIFVSIEQFQSYFFKDMSVPFLNIKYFWTKLLNFNFRSYWGYPYWPEIYEKIKFFLLCWVSIYKDAAQCPDQNAFYPIEFHSAVVELSQFEVLVNRLYLYMEIKSAYIHEGSYLGSASIILHEVLWDMQC